MSNKILLFLIGVECGLLLASCYDLITDVWGTDIDRFLADAQRQAQKAASEATVWVYIASGKTLKILQEQRAKWAGDIAERMSENNGSPSPDSTEKSERDVIGGTSEPHHDVAE